jgi:hypothetical protein
MRIDGIRHSGELRTLHVKCSGEYGVGPRAVLSARLLTEAIRVWTADHPECLVSAVEVDYAAVHYSYGDGPVAAMLALLPLGISEFRLVANSGNCDSLKGLLESLNLPMASFQLIKRDEIDGHAIFQHIELKRHVSPPYQRIPLDEARLRPKSRELAVRLFNEVPGLRRHALMEVTSSPI